MRYIALLRGINVGGNTKVSMPELRKLFEELGFENVATYINSGNVAFDVNERDQRVSRYRRPHGSKGPAEAESFLITEIERSIERHFKLSIQVMVRGQNSIQTILDNNPFDGEFESHKEMHVLFLKHEVSEDQIAALQALQALAPSGERFTALGREIYCHLPMGVADSVLGKGLFEKKLKLAVTGRNWRTVGKLAEL